MKLPNHERAIIDPSKMNDYLLSSSHRDGRHKAVFFSRFGLTLKNRGALEVALFRHAADLEVAREETTAFGMRYVIEGIIQGADGRKPMLRSVWFIESGEDTPRLVTAYPIPGEADDQGT